MVKDINAVLARQQLGGILLDVATKRRHVRITKLDVPVAVVISAAEYEEFLALKAAQGMAASLLSRRDVPHHGGAGTQ